jgi:hypothetical protein
MAKRHLSLLVVAGLLLSPALVLVAAPEVSGVQTERIKKLSHEHPPGADYSWLCGKFAGKPGKK